MRNLKTYTRAPGNKTGFTIVELLIVVVVIAILASITIVSYNGIINRAHQSKLISDVASAGMLMNVDQSASGVYPATRTAVNNGKGINDDADVKYNFYSAPTTFCITAISTHPGIKNYYVSDKNLSPLEGSCAQDIGAQVATIAGSTAGFANGTGTSALMSSPAGLVADPTGNLFFTDSANSRIRMLTTTGVVTTIGGGAGSGYIEGTGTASRFSSPQAVTFGPSNMVYVTDTDNNRIRGVNYVTTDTSFVAGSTQGYQNGTGASAMFNKPRGIVYDPIQYKVLIADSQSNLIRQVYAGGETSTVAGQTTGGLINGTGTSARFNYPQGLFMDSAGTLYIADTLNHAIRKMTQGGVVTTLAGGGTGSVGQSGYTNDTGTTARFSSPMGITVDTAGNVYVADTGNNRIRKITPSGTVTTIAGNGTAGFQDGSGEAGTMFSGPRSIAIGSDGRLYVTDTANHRIRVITNY